MGTGVGRFVRAFMGLSVEAVILLFSNSRTVAGEWFRHTLAKKKCTTVGKSPRLGPRFMVSGEGISIGDYFTCSWDCRVVSDCSSISIGDHVVLSHHVDIAAGPGGRIMIGAYTSIAQFCVLRNCSHRYSDPQVPIQRQGHQEGSIEIGSDCLLAASVIVLPNTRLGDGCVVGSGSVLSGTFPPYSVIVGNPARVVGKRG